MDKIIFLPSAGLGLLFICIYWYRCRVAKKKFDFSVLVNAVLLSSGIVGGILLVAGTIFDEARKLAQEIDLYIFIAGLVVFATAVRGIHSEIFASTKTIADKEKLEK